MAGGFGVAGQRHVVVRGAADAQRRDRQPQALSRPAIDAGQHIRDYRGDAGAHCGAYGSRLGLGLALAGELRMNRELALAGEWALRLGGERLLGLARRRVWQKARLRCGRRTSRLSLCRCLRRARRCRLVRHSGRLRHAAHHRAVIGISQVDDAVPADLDPGDPARAEESPVGALGVGEHPAAPLNLEHTVLPGHTGVVQEDVRRGVPADPVTLPDTQPVVRTARAYHEFWHAELTHYLGTYVLLLRGHVQSVGLGPPIGNPVNYPTGTSFFTFNSPGRRYLP